MQNIDPLYFLTPLVVIGFSFGLVAYLWAKKRFSWWVLVSSLIAYAGAIALKVVLQGATYQPFDAAVGGNPVDLGMYFGLQTVAFEVGGAFLVARYAVARRKIGGRDAAGYGAGLAMWENGVLIGGSLLLDYAVYYSVLGSGGAQASQLFDDLTKASPALFYQASTALPVIGYAVLERVSSLMVHLAWGYLAVMAAVTRRKGYLGVALPMGLVDIFVPLSGSIGVGWSEALFFASGVACLAVAFAATAGTRRTAEGESTGKGSTRNASIVRTTIRRSMSFGRVYLGMGILLPLLIMLPLSGAAGTASAQDLPVLEALPALIIPMFAVLGSVGGLLVFTSDRSKGVYEYLIAYGVDTSTVFWSTIAATVVLASIPLAAGIAESSLALYFGDGVSVSFVEILVFYTIPLSLAAAAFMCAAGMIWSALTTQMAGVNSPAGIAPILGIAPVLAVLLVATRAGSLFVYVAGGASVLLLVVAAAMVYLGTRKMVRERFLSNA
ncbi:MAG: YhfC family intramembrane metalloprotease [Nitrososphaerota archaeon]|nr:YhfC family intramembrane metalloprotease [Nitrososphaerota archaeon]MDG7023228.1 YhfC family intramembrane metalloprotease [Nitrososphaerota archaeon]